MNEDDIDINLFRTRRQQATYNPCSETWTRIKCQAYTLVTKAYDKNLVSLLPEWTFFTATMETHFKLHLVLHKFMSRAHNKSHLAKHQLNSSICQHLPCAVPASTKSTWQVPPYPLPACVKSIQQHPACSASSCFALQAHVQTLLVMQQPASRTYHKALLVMC